MLVTTELQVNSLHIANFSGTPFGLERGLSRYRCPFKFP